MDEILDANPTDKAVHISKTCVIDANASKTCVIDANAPTLCYAAYANDPKKRSGFRYNAALISHPKTKTAAIIAIQDIYVNDEIYVDYGNEYWSPKKQTVQNKNKSPARKKQKQKQNISEEHIEYV